MGKKNKGIVPKVVVIEHNEEEGDIGRVELFTIDGETYTIANKPRANLAVGYLRRAAVNADAAMGYLINEVLDEDALEALEGCDDMTQDDMTSIFQVIQRVALGGLEAPKGS